MFDLLIRTARYFEEEKVAEKLTAIKEAGKEDEFFAHAEKNNPDFDWVNELYSIWLNPRGRLEDFGYWGRFEWDVETFQI